ncbi:phosphoribosylaminoimidazolesuccinocarboxamide synthase [Candidatus Roizmanbacteria bacterium]|nr:phosphoribosylaminoimidazolesuccinocarboxamide synthase [Candidatus Roizmanbacteria bacterium]
MRHELLRNLYPPENFEEGLLAIDIPELGEPIRGKVRDMWVVDDRRVIVTTDRQSAFDRMICTVPGKGEVLNMLSAFWFERTKNLVPNHMEEVPHPNVMIAKEAVERIPVEVVLRRYMAGSSSPTSVWKNYQEGKREIYGIKFPDNLWPNQEFPMGTISTPTTKAEQGHDEMLTDDQAKELVDGRFGKGMWEKTKNAAFTLFGFASRFHRARGLILVDTKLEFGLDTEGNLMLIDEVFTPDSSRFWRSDLYEERFEKAQDPGGLDKEILRKWLAEQGFVGEGTPPIIPKPIIVTAAMIYAKPYNLITGETILHEETDPQKIRQAVLDHLHLQ